MYTRYTPGGVKHVINILVVAPENKQEGVKK